MIIWEPHPGPQLKALTTSVDELLYGGARGGGKTDAGLVWLIKPEVLTNPRARSLVIRKNSDDLKDWVDRANFLYRRYGAVVVGNPPVIRFPSGYKIRTGHLKDDQAYTKYQGHEYQRMLIEELTQIGQEENYLKLLASCRSTLDNLDARIFCTTNPGGVGHIWVKQRFVDPAPPMTRLYFDTKLPDGRLIRKSRMYVPAKMDDNPTLMEKDPGYVATIEMLKDKNLELWKAWRLGDWDTFAGQYFSEFRRDIHVISAFTPKSELFHIGGLDWGRADPFAFLAAIVLPIKWTNDLTGQEHKFYRVIIYKETYGTDKMPREWSELIRTRVNLDALKWVQADNQIYNPGNDNSVSIFTQFVNHDKRWQGRLLPASKERIGGWEVVHNWLSLAPDGLPYLLITDNCTNLIRTLPALVHDENIVEDVDSSGEDHAPDAMRYMLKALKWIDAKVGVVKSRGAYLPTRATPSPILSLDLDKFANVKTEKTTDWRVI